jgi:hypothetical protein
MGYEQGGGYNYGQPDTQYAAEQAAGTFGWDYVGGQMADARFQAEWAQQLEGEAAALRARNAWEARVAANNGSIVGEHAEPEFENTDGEWGGEVEDADSVWDSKVEPDLTGRDVNNIKSSLSVLTDIGFALEEDQHPVDAKRARRRLAARGIITSDQDDASALLSRIIDVQQQELRTLLVSMSGDSPFMHYLPGVHFQSLSLRQVSYGIESVEYTNGGEINGMLHLSRSSNIDGETSRVGLHRNELIDALSQGKLDETFAEHTKSN